MGETEIIRHDVNPYFDLELYLGLCQANRLSGEDHELLTGLWDKWSGQLRSCEVRTGNAGTDRVRTLAVWLPREVEDEIERHFAESPSKGFMLDNLASYMCMAAVAELLPPIQDLGCAPVPRASLELAQALNEAGLSCRLGEGLVCERRYMVLTPFPFRGGCEICSLQDNCPRQKNYSMVLPGHERPGDSLKGS